MKSTVLLFTVAVILTACQSSGPNAVQRGTPGEEVNSLCFSNQINGWQPLSRNAIILERGLNDYYQVSFNGACDATRSGLSMATDSRSGICLEIGDEVDFANDFSSSCSIESIHAWTPAPE